MENLFRSGDLELAGHLARPRIAPGTSVPGLVISHGFPHRNQGGGLSARSFPELADRIATEMGWMVLVFTFRGAGDSEGDFSLRGWRDDLLAAAAYLRGVEGVRGVWAAGFGTGGSLSISAAAIDPEIRGVACMGAPADFDDWENHPRRLLLHARETGMIRSTSYPTNFEAWAREVRDVRAVEAIRDVAPRPVLIMHGSDDDSVPVFDARVLADAHGSADLRIIEGGAHQLRDDPRAIAVLLGWLDRQRSAAAAQFAG
jgi:pimeloyl-ACP methyl ester carboxylesterase